MKFLEKDLEDYIYYVNNKRLAKEGLNFYYYKKFRQLKIGKYGVADLITISKPPFLKDIKIFPEKIYITVYELKKDELNNKTFFQAIRYLTGIKRYLKKRGKNLNNYCFNIVLLGKTLNLNEDLCYLPDIFYDYEGHSMVEIYLYKIENNSIEFELQENFKLTDEGF
jgi:hypothetical protein